MSQTPIRSTALPRFPLLYAALYAAFGVASPFLPALVNARELPAAQLGLVLSSGTGAGARATVARPHLCAAASRLHAAARPYRAAWPRRDGAGTLWHGRHWRRHRWAHPGGQCALRPGGSARVLGHGGA